MPDQEAVEVELTKEQIEAKVKEMQNAVAAFLADPRHDTYQAGVENKNAIETYLRDHNLDLNEESLHVAFVECSKTGKLTLYAESKLEAAKEKSEEQKPASTGKETDSSVSLSMQQRLRRQTVAAGPRSSNRDALIRASQNAPRTMVKGGRFHL